jgi:hypothetical protein
LQNLLSIQSADDAVRESLIAAEKKISELTNREQELQSQRDELGQKLGAAESENIRIRDDLEEMRTESINVCISTHSLSEYYR